MKLFKAPLLFICIFGCLSFAAKPAVADQVHVGLFAPWSFFHSAIRKYVVSVANYHNAMLADQIWPIDQLNWHIQGIKLNSSVTLSQDNLTLSSYEMKADHVAIQMNIGKIWVDQTIQKTISGVVFNIHISATCGPISLTQSNAKADLKIDYRLLPASVAASISSLNLNWQPSSWAIAPISCQGPKGFSTTLTQALEQELNSPALIENFATQKLTALLNKQLQLINSRIGTAIPLQIPSVPLPLTYTLSHFQNVKSGVLISTALTWPNTGSNYQGPQLPIAQLPTANLRQPEIFSLKQDWPHMLQGILSALPAQAPLDLNKSNAFEGLLSSRFEEFFIWPDLVNYHSWAPFSLTLSRLHLDSFRWQNNVDFNASADGVGWVRAFRDGQYWQYVDFSGAAKFDCSPKILGGVLSLQVNVHDGRLSHEYAAAYSNHYDGLDPYINDDYLLYSAENWSSPYNEIVPLFSLNLGVLGLAQFAGLKAEPPNLIALPLEINSP